MVTTNLMTGFCWVSWGAVFGGALVGLALWMVMAIIGLALGFKVVDPKSNEPASGLGKTIGGWTVATNIVSYAGGAFMTGLLASHRGVEHGLIFWALVTVIMVLFSTQAVGAAVRAMMGAAKGLTHGAAGLAGAAAHAGSSAAHAASSVGSSLSNAASGPVSQLKETISRNLDPETTLDKLNENVTDVLRDSGVESLKPETLKEELNEVRRDFKKLIRQLSAEPTEYSEAITNFLDKEKNRLQAITEDVDRETAVTTLMKRREIPREEAEKLVDNALDTYRKAVDKSKKAMANAREHLEDARDNIKDMADQARVRADKISNAIAKGAAAAALGLVLAAALSMGLGYWGARCGAERYAMDAERYAVDQVMIIDR